MILEFQRKILLTNIWKRRDSNDILEGCYRFHWHAVSFGWVILAFKISNTHTHAPPTPVILWKVVTNSDRRHGDDTSVKYHLTSKITEVTSHHIRWYAQKQVKWLNYSSNYSFSISLQFDMTVDITKGNSPLCHNEPVAFSTGTLSVMWLHLFTVWHSVGVDGLMATSGSERRQTKPYSRVNTKSRANVIRMAGSVTEVN